MTVIEMNHDFLLKAKSLDRVDVKDILSYDAVALLNQAQDIVIDELLANKNYAMLRPITESVDTVVASFDATYDSGINGANVVNLTSLVFASPDASLTYRSYIRSSSKILHTAAPVFALTDVSNEEVPVEIIRDFEANGSTVPIFTNPKCFVEGDYLIVLADGYSEYTLGGIVSVVLRNSRTLILALTATETTVTHTITCELPSQIHQIIVNKAVEIYQSTVNINDLKK